MQYLKSFSAFLFILLLSLSAFSQTKTGEEEEIQVDTQFVEVPIIVTDKSGKPILNLKTR